MNLALLRSGYPLIAVHPGEQQARYIAALDASHTDEAPYAANRRDYQRASIA